MLFRSVMLTGGRSVNGPVASGVAGQVYRQLSNQNFFADAGSTGVPGLVASEACCGQ